MINTYENSITAKAVKILKTGKANTKIKAAYEMAAMASAMQGAIDCLSQNKIFPADIAHAKSLLANAMTEAGIEEQTLGR